jgi:hypothetical protein
MRSGKRPFTLCHTRSPSPADLCLRRPASKPPVSGSSPNHFTIPPVNLRGRGSSTDYGDQVRALTEDTALLIANARNLRNLLTPA